MSTKQTDLVHIKTALKMGSSIEPSDIPNNDNSLGGKFGRTFNSLQPLQWLQVITFHCNWVLVFKATVELGNGRRKSKQWKNHKAHRSSRDLAIFS